MGLFFKDYKPDITQCARKYSSEYQDKYKDDSLEEKAAAIRLFSHISDFVNEVSDNEVKKAVRSSRFGIDEVTLNMLHNLFLIYINEAVNMTGETFLSTAVKAYRFVNDIKYEKHMIDCSQYEANDELLYSIVPASAIENSTENNEYYEDLSDITKPMVDSAIRVGELFGYSKDEVLKKMEASKGSTPVSEDKFEFKESNDLAIELIDKDYDDGFISFPGMPLPILYDEAEDVAQSMLDYIRDYFEKEVDEGRMQKSRLPYNVYHTTLVWCALAGIGAAELWRQKGKRLLQLGVVYNLTKERGFFAMDEYVMDLVTDGFESDEAKAIKERLELHIQPLLHNLLVDLPAKGIDTKTYNRQFSNYCTALYNYGLVMQDERSDTDEKESLTDKELCGEAWLQIASQEHMEEGLEVMRELSGDLFDEAILALAMFTTDQEERRNLLEQAATMGNAEAIWQFSAAYLSHSYNANSGDKKDKKWLEYCVIAAENNSVDAMNELGNIFHRQKNYAESMYWYAMANSNGKENGQVSMAGIAKEWKMAGAPRDHIKGTERFDENRFKCSIAYLEIYAGLAMTTSVKEIYELALSGTAIAGYLAGDIYESKGNLEMAFQAYKAIAYEYDPHGLKCYADMLLTGRGTERNIKEAFEQYEEAANCGDIESMFTMGEYYRNEGNKNIAAFWYGKAYARGYVPAETRLIQMTEDK